MNSFWKPDRVFHRQKSFAKKNFAVEITIFLTCFIIGMALAAFTGPAQAAQPSDDLQPVKAVDLRVATGKAGKGYAKLPANITAVCGDKVTLGPSDGPTTGGLKNLLALSANEADIGFAQLDTWKTMSGDENIKRLQAVAMTGYNLMHVVTRDTGYPVTTNVKSADKMFGLMKGGVQSVTTAGYVTKFSDLRNTKYTIGLVGSAQLMGQTLDRTLGYGMAQYFKDYETDASAFADLINGKLAAVLTVSAYKHGELKDKTWESHLRLVPFDLQPTGDYSVVRKSYDNLRAYNMSFLAVPNILFTQPFRPGGTKGKAVAALQTCLRSHLDDLSEGSFEPVWKDASMTKLYDVPAFKGDAAAAKK